MICLKDLIFLNKKTKTKELYIILSITKIYYTKIEIYILILKNGK